MDDKKIEAGDVVILRSDRVYENPVSMTVAELIAGGVEAVCMWFDRDGNLFERCIKLMALQLVEAPSADGFMDEDGKVGFEMLREAVSAISDEKRIAMGQAAQNAVSAAGAIVCDLEIQTESIQGPDGVNSPGDTVMLFVVLIPKRVTPPA